MTQVNGRYPLAGSQLCARSGCPSDFGRSRDSNVGWCAVFCDVGFCVGTSGSCIQTTGSTCAPTSTVVNEPCPAPSTYCTTTDGTQPNGFSLVLINSQCDGEGSCNPNQGTQGRASSPLQLMRMTQALMKGFNKDIRCKARHLAEPVISDGRGKTHQNHNFPW